MCKIAHMEGKYGHLRPTTFCLDLKSSNPNTPPASPFSFQTEKVGGIVVEAACVIELPFLGGRGKVVGTDLFVLVEKEGK